MTYEERLSLGDSLEFYDEWPEPVCIVSDGAYGVSGFPGDPPGPDGLKDWYRPHIKKWAECATPQTTLWFWNTEIGWAEVHPLLKEHGWEYQSCNIWNKGIAHVAGNSNTKTLRRFPAVTEVCVQYTRSATFEVEGEEVEMKKWLRYEWERSGLPLYKANDACDVKSAASRKYLTQCHLWYFPPPEAFQKLADYANQHGDPEGRPYFSLDGEEPLTADDWRKMRSKFDLEPGLTNVWEVPALRGAERIRTPDGLGHPNQKPLKLVERVIKASTSVGDMVWEPFGGLFTGSVAAECLDRKYRGAELVQEFYEIAINRFKEMESK